MTHRLLAVALVLCGALPAIAVEPQELFARLDANGDGQLTRDEIPAEQQRLFDRLLRLGDQNRDGRLNPADLARGLAPQQGDTTLAAPIASVAPQFDVEQLFQLLDRNGDGQVVKTEARNQIRENFERLDRNGDGGITMEELKRVAERMQSPPAMANPAATERRQQLLLGMLRRADRNNDGNLSREEAPSRLKANFDRIDGNGDGQLSEEEIRRLLERLRQFSS